MIGGGPGQWCLHFILVHAHTIGYRCKRVLCIDLALVKISIPLVSKELRNRLHAFALEVYIYIRCLIYRILLSRHLCTKPNP